MNWNSCIRLFEVNEKKKNKAQDYIDRVLRNGCDVARTLSQCETTNTQRIRSLFFTTLCIELQSSFFVCVCVWMYAIIVVSGCLCEYVSHTTIARRSVNHRALLHGWKINCIEHIAHVVLSLIHICIRISVSSFFFSSFEKNKCTVAEFIE